MKTREITISTDLDFTSEELKEIVNNIASIMKKNKDRKSYHISGWHIDENGDVDTYSQIENEALKTFVE